MLVVMNLLNYIIGVGLAILIISFIFWQDTTMYYDIDFCFADFLRWTGR